MFISYIQNNKSWFAWIGSRRERKSWKKPFLATTPEGIRMYNEKFKKNIKTYEKDLKEAGIGVKFEWEKARLNSLVYGSLEAFQKEDISKKEKLIFEHHDMKKIETMVLDSKAVNEVFKIKNEIEWKEQSLIDGIKPYKLLCKIYDILMKRIE